MFSEVRSWRDRKRFVRAWLILLNQKLFRTYINAVDPAHLVALVYFGLAFASIHVWYFLRRLERHFRLLNRI